VSMTPERIRESAHETYQRIQFTIEVIKEAYKEAVNLCKEVVSNDQIATANEVEAACDYLTRAIGHLNEAYQHNKEYERTADALENIEAEADTGHNSDTLITACHEKLKTGLVDLEPGETYTLSVTRKVEDADEDIHPTDFVKRILESYRF